MAACKHNWIYTTTDYRFMFHEGYPREYYYCKEHYVCKKCRGQKTVEKRYSRYSTDTDTIPEWVETLASKVLRRG